MDDQPETVSSADMVRNFGYWQDRASLGPVVITYRGRPRHMLVAVNAWREACVSSADTPLRSLRDLQYTALIERISGGFVVIDHQFCIRELSNAAALLLGRPIDEIVGLSAEDVLNQFGIGAAVPGMRRVLTTGEDSQFDLPIAGPGRRRVRGQAYTWVSGLALNITAYHELAEDVWLAEQLALEKARNAHGAIAVMRLSVRGTIVAAEAQIIDLIGVDRDRILQARLVDLLTVDDRPTARDVIEDVLGGVIEVGAFDGRLLSNIKGETLCRFSVAPLADGFAIGGAIVLLTVQEV